MKKILFYVIIILILITITIGLCSCNSDKVVTSSGIVTDKLFGTPAKDFIFGWRLKYTIIEGYYIQIENTTWVMVDKDTYNSTFIGSYFEYNKDLFKILR